MQSPGNLSEGARLMNRGKKFFRTANNKHEGYKIFIEHLLVSGCYTRCYIYNDGPDGYELHYHDPYKLWGRGCCPIG